VQNFSLSLAFSRDFKQSTVAGEKISPSKRMQNRKSVSDETVEKMIKNVQKIDRFLY